MTMTQTEPHFDIIVAGLGPAGLTAALAVAQATAARGSRVCAIGAPAAAGGLDTRTTALLGPSVALLEHLGVWPRCRLDAAPIDAIRLFDDTGRLLRAPDITFHARELQATKGGGRDPAPFGWNIPNARLTAALRWRAQAMANLDIVETAGISRILPDATQVRIELAGGQAFDAPLLVGADGRHSMCRAAAGIGTRLSEYPQTAIACNFAHTRPHDNVSTEFHRPSGPFTTVPLPDAGAGFRSSLVWVERPDEATRLMTLTEAAFACAMEARLRGLLGQIRVAGPRTAFPLARLSVSILAQNRIALVGEAAHVLPPIGAQGLNLGFRDCAALAECVAEAATLGQDIGGPAVMDAYKNARRTDVWTRTAAIDVLNRSLMSELLPAQALRGLGLHLLNSIGPLRRAMMRAGMGQA